jgi:ATP-dependent exoDNAse (exonuclease V) alpha subunit
MSNTPSQDAALAAFSAWRDTESTVFGLFGGPGTGKSYLTAQILASLSGEIICCAPTHKAAGVLRRFLDRAGLPWEERYDAFWHREGNIVTGTTSALLGIGPVVVDEQDEKEVKFGRRSQGVIEKFPARWVLIDEVSMLPRPHFNDLVSECKARGVRIIVVGDQAQLPPVKAEAIPLDRLTHQATLVEPMRQGPESVGILRLAAAVRDDEDWDELSGPGIERVGAFTLERFLEAVGVPEEQEEDRAVYIAYRNALVDRAQEQACQKVYGHGRRDIREGELVVCETNIYRGKDLLASNQSELIVAGDLGAGEFGGRVVELRRVGRGGTFEAEWLPDEEFRNPAGAWNVACEAALKQAKTAQEGWVKGGRRRGGEDETRKALWAHYFELRDQTVLALRHPFAMTSHKSQGSTVRAVYAEANDLARYSKAGLYVAVTRPREKIVY